MGKTNTQTNPETPFNQDNSPHISGSSVTGVGKIDTNRIRVYDLTAKRVYFEPTEPNK